MIINVGNVKIGTDYIPIQTMIKNSIKDKSLTIKKIKELAKIKCDIVRITIPDEESVKYLKEIIKDSPIPIVADIHFDYKLAIQSIKAGVHKIRINPGNIRNEDKVKEVIFALKEYNIPVRIGINAGSLPKHLKDKFKDEVIIMLEAAKEEIGYFEKYNYDKIILSFKSSNVLNTISVNKKAKEIFDFPLHIGITEAGDLIDGTIKNSIGISNLLLNGIGDTIRVSLTSTEFEEIKVAQKILESIGKKVPEIEIISCPTCGRTEVDIQDIVSKVKDKMINKKLNKKLKIAIMGCVVNGPGEAEGADFGVACGKNQSVIFKDGKKLKVVKNFKILDELLILLSEYYVAD